MVGQSDPKLMVTMPLLVAWMSWWVSVANWVADLKMRRLISSSWVDKSSRFFPFFRQGVAAGHQSRMNLLVGSAAWRKALSFSDGARAWRFLKLSSTFWLMSWRADW